MGRRRYPSKWIMVVGGVILMFAAPSLVSHDAYYLTILTRAAITSITALGVWLVMIAGQYPFGQAGIMAIGSYTSVLIVVHLDMSFWVALPIAALSAGLFALIVGYPALRTKGMQFALLTLAMGGAIRQLIINTPDITGGQQGIFSVPVPGTLRLFGMTLFEPTTEGFYFLSITVLIIVTGFLGALVTSRFGDILRAVRLNDSLAESLGINARRYSLFGFVVASFLAGLSGSLFVHYQQVAQPDFYGLFQSVALVAFVIVGGLGSVIGPILGTFVLISLTEFLRPLGPYQAVAYAGLLLGVILFLPGGIVSLPASLLKTARRLVASSRHHVALRKGVSGTRPRP